MKQASNAIDSDTKLPPIAPTYSLWCASSPQFLDITIPPSLLLRADQVIDR